MTNTGKVYSPLSSISFQNLAPRVPKLSHIKVLTWPNVDLVFGKNGIHSGIPKERIGAWESIRGSTIIGNHTFILKWSQREKLLLNFDPWQKLQILN